MRISTECRECLCGLARQASRLATGDEALCREALLRAQRYIDEELKPGVMSIHVATPVHHIIRQATGNPDPYRAVKDLEIDEARQIFGIVKGSFGHDFISLLHLAAMGNAIDFFRPIGEVIQEIKKLKLKFTVDDSGILESRVRGAGFVLYLADNAGEVFFDMPLLNLMRRYARVVYVVKEGPVQNDVTLDDVRRAGLEAQAGEMMTTGTATPGIIMEQASARFKDAFDEAGFVFAKGMGYYEALEELPAGGRIFFCLKAKCGPVARSLGVPLNSYVAKLH